MLPRFSVRPDRLLSGLLPPDRLHPGSWHPGPWHRKAATALCIVIAAIVMTSDVLTSDVLASDATPPNPVAAPNRETADPRPALPPNPVIRPALAPLTSAGAATRQIAVTRADPIVVSEAGDACLGALERAGVTFQPVGTHDGQGVCGIEDAVRVHSIGPVALSPSALLACPTALAFSRFLSDTLIPEAGRAFGSAPATVHVAASYACRSRNNVAGARVSEHGFGRAIDVRAITMQDGQGWSVRPQPEGASTPQAGFQAAVRQAACGPFTTVLGPGSDGHHQDHLHFDTAPRSRTYCR